MRATLADALALAERQRERLQRGEVDAYLEAFDEYGALCRAAAGSAQRGDRAALEQLVAIDAQINKLLVEAKAAAGRKLNGLSQGRTANAAYLPHVAPRRSALFEG